jgi:hypothetical protein
MIINVSIDDVLIDEIDTHYKINLMIIRLFEKINSLC